MALVAAPETHYARLDGRYLAYQVSGEGERDIVVLSQNYVPIDLMWDDPLLARGLRRLASFGRLIAVDLRGWGASSEVDLNSLPAMQAWTDDIGCVMDAAGARQSALFGSAETCLPAMLFAATHPDRTRALVLNAPYARFVRTLDYPFGMPEQVATDYVAAYRNAIGTGELVDFLAPSRATDVSFRRWWARSERLGCPPSTAVRIYEMFMRTDVTGILDAIQSPTLIVRRAGDWHGRDGHARYIAERVPHATLVELAGNDHLWFSGDVDEFMDQIEQVLTGMRAPPTTNRTLATVLFTDIVDSTGQASQLSDAPWTSLLARHDEIAVSHVDAFGGRLVKSTGDGILATFDGPARAIYCAVALREALIDIGVSIRGGIHTGEIEWRGDDVGGIAIHIGARVVAKAQPAEVLVSRTVTDLVAGSGIALSDRGDHELKGVPGKWQLFAIEA